MGRFQDYLSSAITPQMTLLEKYNALIKFLKENNFISVFYSSQDYNPNTLNYNISNVMTLDFELKLGDCLIFSNGYYAFVETIGENTFTIGNILYFQGEQGVSVISANINSNGNLILTLSNGTTINAGNTGAVKDFIIDSSQHLIVRYLNGTQNDLGDIFTGNININGNFNATNISGDAIIENMQGYGFETPTPSFASVNIDYAGVVKNGNKITYAISGVINFSSFPSSGNAVLGTFVHPVAIGNKLFPSTIGGVSNILSNKELSFSSSFTSFSDCPCICFKNGATKIYFQIFSVASHLSLNTDYHFRIEETFLLSDSLAS